MSRSPEGHGLRYAPGLDGVRALAVGAVFAYHLGATGAGEVLPGGFLGVDVFFVLSGYLITSLLLVERGRTGRICLKDFYVRRARRLLPALYALLLAVAAIGAFWLPQQATRLRGDLLASLGYVTNWWLIAQDSSYFAAAGDRPPMLTHLWSLAVEEQYYLVWPLVLIALTSIRATRRLLLIVALLGIAGSTLAGLVLYDPFIDPSRVYYGTDTRALAPLIGSAVAIAVRPWAHRPRPDGATRTGRDMIGLGALLLLAGIATFLDDTDELLYRGGFVVIAVLAAALVGVAGHPGSLLGRALGRQPLRYLGERSYAIYLWHWPVCLVTRPGLDLPLTGWANAGLRVGVTLLLAELSYHLVEKPIRRNGFLAPLRRASAPPAGRPASTGAAVAAGTAGTAGTTLNTTVTRPEGWSEALLPPLPVHSGPAHPPLPAARARPPALTAPRASAARRRGPVMRTALLTIVVLAGGTAAGVGLNRAAGLPSADGPVDTGEDQNLGALPTLAPVTPAVTSVPASAPASPSSTTAAARSIPPGTAVVFFGDSQPMTLLLNKPADLGKYINAVDASIEGCGILLGKVVSRSGEKRNLTASCRNWRSTWMSRAARYQPRVAVVMIGAWDVFDLTLDSGQTLPFGSPAWDANFSAALEQAITALLPSTQHVALALLPCYRPLAKSAGYWPERGDDQRTRHVNELLRAGAQAHAPAVTVLEPPAQFCTDPVIANDTAYRWDGVHYYKKGAALYFTTTLPQLLDAPQA